MNKREQLIKQCFHSWIVKNIEKFINCFSADVFYSECYGPEYHGIEQIEKWFIDWNKQGAVLDWHIKQFIHQDKVTVVEWFFKCNCEGKISGFDGVSIIFFNNDNKISLIKEFQSKAAHYSPYDTV